MPDLPPRPQPPSKKAPAAWLALIFFILAGLLSLVSDSLLALLPVSPVQGGLQGSYGSMFLDLAFAGFTAILLYILLAHYPVGGERRAHAIPQPHPWAPLTTFTLFALGLIATGLFIFSAQRQAIQAGSEAQLRAVGELRIEQLQHWLRVNNANVRQFGRDAALASRFAAWIAGGKRDSEAEQRIRNQLQDLRELHGYRGIALFDLQGRLALVDHPDPWMGEHEKEAREAIRSEAVQLVDFHHHGDGAAPPMLGMMAPMRLEEGPATRSVGALLVTLPAKDSLFALLRRWPTPSASGETILLRQEGQGMRLLFASRGPDPGMQEPLILLPADAPAYKAVHAGSGVLGDVLDFRREPTLAYAHPVKGTPWILATKLDRVEVDAPVARLAKSTGLVISLLLALAGLAFWLWWRNQTHRQQAQLLGKELERRVLERHFYFLSRYANDAILLLDSDGRILEANDRVQDMYGYTRDELLGQGMERLRPADLLAEFKATLASLLTERQLRFETEHQHKDGRRFPVEVSGRHFQEEGVERIHVIIRDISARRQTEEQLRMQALVLDQIQDKVTVTDLAGVVTYVNEAECRAMNLPRDALIGQHVREFGDGPEADARQDEIVAATLAQGTWGGKVLNLGSAGDRRIVDLRTSLIRDRDGEPRYMVGLGTDITERVLAEQAIRNREIRYRAVVETSPDGFWVIDEQGHLLEVNEAYCRRSGYSREALQSMCIADLEGQLDQEQIEARIQQIKSAGNALFETQHRARDGSLWQVEINATYSTVEGGRLFIFIRDIQQRNRADALLRTRLKLSDLALTGTLDQIMQGAVDAAELFTGSSIGFFHFVEPDQENLSLQAWSGNTLKSMCTAEGKGLHYPVSQAGVWADSVREKRILIHNDYASLPGRKGMPAGHAPVVRELVVPVLRNGLVVAVLGVGNKGTDYKDEDADAVGQIVSMVMDMVERKRAEEALTLTNQRLREAQSMARMGYWEYDVDTDKVTWSEQIYAILGLEPGTPPPNFAGHRALIVAEDFPGFEMDVKRAMETGASYQHEVRVLRPDGSIRHLWHTGQGVRDAQGRVVTLVGTVQDISERRLAEARLEMATHFDVLTGLPNARLMLEKIGRALLGATPTGADSPVMALLLLNIDRFAQLNETLGRAAGDQVLSEAARRWREGLPESCLLGRLDADRFIVLVREGGDDRSIMETASALNAALRAPIKVDAEGRSVSLTASIGIALYPADAQDAAALLHAAEDAMRRAKADKGGQVRFFDREHARAAIDWFETEAALRLALDRDEFFLLYQPQVDAGSGRAVAAEALIRWRRNGQVVPPAQFIQVVEGTDLAEPVSRWVLRQACRQARIWRDRQHPLRVAVNIFSDHVTSGHLLDDVTAALAESGLPPELLELEVLESSLLKNPEAAARNLREIKRRGVRLALDDFGTGYSSLGYLKHYPFDVLKIDQIFSRNVTRDPEDAAIVRSTISLAHNLGMGVLAEGVETEPQLRFMARYGCDQVQGYLLSRPVNPEAVETLAMERRDLRPRGAGGVRPLFSVLIVEDEALEAERLSLILEDAGFLCFVAEDLDSTMAIMGRERIDLIMADHYLGRGTGVEILERMLQLFPDVPRVMASGSTDHRVIMDAVNQAGIRAYLAKPVLPETLLATLRGILRETRHG